MKWAMNLDDYSHFEKAIFTPATIARLLIALCGIIGIFIALFAGISLESGPLAIGGAVLALISAGLFYVTGLIR
jgi:hypothetical protein